MSRFHPIDGRVLPPVTYVPREEALALARRAAEVQRGFRRTPWADRAAIMRRAAVLFRERRDTLATTMADEMGKPVVAGRSEVDKCAHCFEFYAERAEAYLAPRTIETDATTSYVAYQPLGIILPSCRGTSPFGRRCASAPPR